MNYYSLVAGLPDLHPDDSKGFLTLEKLRDELNLHLTASDKKLLSLLYAKYDNRNFLKFLKDRDAVLDPLGSIHREDWKELLVFMEEFEDPNDDRLPPYITSYYRYSQQDEKHTQNLSPEDYLSGLYYEYAMEVDNQFLREWFEFNLNLNNLLTAITSRVHDFDPQKLIIGNNEVAKILRTSHARDYGIGGFFEYTDEVIKIAEVSNLLEREKKIDALKWEWLEEHTFFNYFSIEKILAFVLKTEILERWKMLSFEEGSAIFRKILSSLKQDVNINV